MIRTIASTEDAVEINQFVSAMKHMLITLQPTKTLKHADKASVPVAIVFNEFIYNPLDVSAQESPV